jgi:hypothetical protein
VEARPAVEANRPAPAKEGLQVKAALAGRAQAPEKVRAMPEAGQVPPGKSLAETEAITIRGEGNKKKGSASFRKALPLQQLTRLDLTAYADSTATGMRIK